MFQGAIDFSHWNGKIKWNRLPPTYRLVFLKATEGRAIVDSQWEANEEGALSTDRLVVPYHFISLEPADLQAAHFVQTAGLRPGSPTMLDWESPNPKTLPPIALVEQLCNNIEIATRRKPLVYHGIYTLASKAINACPWFVPKYGPEPKGKWLFWQDRPNLVVDGVAGPCDHDCFNGTELEMELWHKSGALPHTVELV